MNERSIVVFFDNFRVLDLIIQLDDLSLVGGLLVAGGVVFGVFRKVAVAARFRDALDDFLPFGGLQKFQSFHRLVISLLCHKKLICHNKYLRLWCRSAAASLPPRAIKTDFFHTKTRSPYGTLKIQP